MAKTIKKAAKKEAPKASNVKKAPKNAAKAKAGVKKVPTTKVNKKAEAPKASAIPKAPKSSSKKTGKYAPKVSAKGAGHSQGAGHWFNRLSKQAQIDYIATHPGSKFAKAAKASGILPSKQAARKAVTAKKTSIASRQAAKEKASNTQAARKELRSAVKTEKHARIEQGRAEKALTKHKAKDTKKMNAGAKKAHKAQIDILKSKVKGYGHTAKLASKIVKSISKKLSSK